MDGSALSKLCALKNEDAWQDAWLEDPGLYPSSLVEQGENALLTQPSLGDDAGWRDHWPKATAQDDEAAGEGDEAEGEGGEDSLGVRRVLGLRWEPVGKEPPADGDDLSRRNPELAELLAEALHVKVRAADVLLTFGLDLMRASFGARWRLLSSTPSPEDGEEIKHAELSRDLLTQETRALATNDTVLRLSMQQLARLKWPSVTANSFILVGTKFYAPIQMTGLDALHCGIYVKAGSEYFMPAASNRRYWRIYSQAVRACQTLCLYDTSPRFCTVPTHRPVHDQMEAHRASSLRLASLQMECQRQVKSRFLGSPMLLTHDTIERVWPTKTTISPSSATLPFPTFGNGQCFDPGVKGEERLCAKTAVKYSGDLAHMKDVSRFALLYPTIEALLDGLRAIQRLFPCMKIENRFRHPTVLGWRDITVLIEVRPNACPLCVQHASTRPRILAFLRLCSFCPTRLPARGARAAASSAAHETCLACAPQFPPSRSLGR